MAWQRFLGHLPRKKCFGTDPPESRFRDEPQEEEDEVVVIVCAVRVPVRSLEMVDTSDFN